MNNSRLSLYLQSVRGPVLLMTLGILCALHQAEVASFRLTWPILIIVVGFLVLGERLTAPPVVAPPPFPAQPVGQWQGAAPGAWAAQPPRPPQPPPMPPQTGGPR